MSPEKKAIILASCTAIFLIVLKSVAWIFTGSMTILTSAIDSTLDFFVSLMNFFAIKKSEEPIDEDHNYWHWKIEWFWALFEWLIIFLSWISVIYLSIGKLLKNDIIKKTDESIYIMLIAILATFSLVLFLKKIASQTWSLIIKSDLLHYKTDLYINIWVVISLIIIKIFKFPIIDPIISIIIAFYIMYWSFDILKEWYHMLMDRSLESDIVDFIQNTVLSHDEINDFHFLRTRKSWKNSFIEFHIVFNNINILLKDAHDISDFIEAKIMQKIPNSTVTIHLDYFDDSNKNLL